MPAAGLTPISPATASGQGYAVLGLAARWLGCLNALGALAVVGFVLGVLGADVAPPDLSFPLAIYLAGVLASGLAMLSWGMAQTSGAAGRGSSRGVSAANWIGVVAYATGLLAFAAGCWASAELGVESSNTSLETASLAYGSVR